MARLHARMLTGTIVISVLLRLGAAFYLGNEVVELPGTADQLSYHNLALRVLEGYGFTFGENWWPATPANAPTAHWSYLYTAYLVLVYGLIGPYPLAARLIQAIVTGVLQPYLAYHLGAHLFGRIVGLATAAITAGYAYFIYYSANLMTESFYIVAILASLYLGILLAGSSGEQGDSRLRWKHGLMLGLTLVVAVLLRQLFLLFIPFFFLWVGWASRGRQIKSLVIASTVIIACILPFTAFNFTRFGRFVLLNTNAGFAFFWGNHPIYGTKFEPILPPELGSYHSLIPRELLHLDEAALDQALLRRGIQFILDDPLRYGLLSLSRIPPYFAFWPSSDSGDLSNVARVASFGIFWPFMLYGLLRSLLCMRTAPLLRPPSPLLLLLLFVTIYSGIHILTWTLIRYRLPVDAIMVIFAGLAIVDLVARLPALRQFVKPVA